MGKQTDRMQIFERQAHAFAHLVESPLPYQVAVCPLCLGPFGDGDVHGCEEHQPTVGIEHAPPKQRTRLGERRGACLTHIDCQGGIKYESEAGRYRSDLNRLRSGQRATVRGQINGLNSWVTLQRENGVVRPIGTTEAQLVAVPLTLPPSAQLTELKAAYLIAFTTLGYCWATKPGLDAVRAALRTGDIRACGRIPLFITSSPNADVANTVLVAEASDRVAVIGDDPMFGVLLPLSQPFIADDEMSMSMKGGYALPWLPDRWWRQASAPAFRWDCTATQPLWRVELDTAGGMDQSEPPSAR